MQMLRDVWAEESGRHVLPERGFPPDDEQSGSAGERFSDWLDELGCEDGGRWCCPVSDGFSAGWRAGYADGVQAAIRLLQAAHTRDMAAPSDLWSRLGLEERHAPSSAPPPPVPFGRGRMR